MNTPTPYRHTSYATAAITVTLGRLERGIVDTNNCRTGGSGPLTGLLGIAVRTFPLGWYKGQE